MAGSTSDKPALRFGAQSAFVSKGRPGAYRRARRAPKEVVRSRASAQSAFHFVKDGALLDEGAVNRALLPFTHLM